MQQMIDNNRFYNIMKKKGEIKMNESKTKKEEPNVNDLLKEVSCGILSAKSIDDLSVLIKKMSSMDGVDLWNLVTTIDDVILPQMKKITDPIMMLLPNYRFTIFTANYIREVANELMKERFS